MRQTTLLAAVLILLSGVVARGQDVLTIASDVAPAGGTSAIAVSLLDRSGTALGIDAGSGNRIQGFAFKVLFPGELIASVAFTRAGAAASITPMHETALQGSGWSACIVSFNESTSPLPVNLNTTAPGDRIGTLTVTMRGDAPVGSVARLLLDPPAAMLSNQAGTARETVAAGNLSLVHGSITVTAVQTPANLVATADGTSQVNVTWTAAAGASHYEVWRSSGGAYALIGSPAAPPLTDSGVLANTAYLYRVRAIAGSGGPSAYSNVDVATTIVFADEPLVAHATKVRAVHLAQLRTAVDAVRVAAGLAPLGSDPTVAIGSIVRAAHITDLRTALGAARGAAGLSAIGSTDAVPSVIKGVHVQELRNGVK